MGSTFVPPPAPHVADYIVIAIFLCVCIGIGVYYGYQTNKNPTLENYFFGNRRLLVVPVAMSIFVTFISAISVMGIPAEIYLFGIRMIHGVVAYVLSICIANVTVVPLLYPLKLTSTYEYLQHRYNSKSVRLMGTAIGMLHTVIYMGIALYAPALALEIVAGIPLWVSIVVIGFVCTIYTTIGGIKSVVWTDVFQCIMLFVGMIAVIIKGTILIGPSHSILGIATEGKRLEHFNFDPDPRIRYSNWGLWIGLVFSNLANWCNQASVQRISSLRSLKSAYFAFWMLGPLLVMFYTILGYLGILIYSYYNTLECDPLQGEFISNINQLTPYFVLDVLQTLPGFSGVFISCLFSGALSTFSSGINSLAANTVEDILGDCVKKSKIISQTLVAKLFVISYGLAVIGLAYAINSLPGSVMQMAGIVFGACGGPMSGLFYLGGMVPKANWIGAIVGSVTALVFNIWIAVGAQLYGNRPEILQFNPTNRCFPDNITTTMVESTTYNYNITTASYDTSGYSSQPINNHNTSDEGFFLYNVSYTWYGFTGFFLTLIVGTVVSLCTGGDREETVDARLIFPVCRKVFRLEPNCTYQLTENKPTLEQTPASQEKISNEYHESIGKEREASF
ncbi:sodium-coupled monocarboxylate transporter 1-like [Ylistrum balloti]|uniref:sodium-coupled monocarboxylate transporter 1-like n=1 Tax=Ylistrum balloti TaxID=509963 RepID=UPI002905B4B9|nr:sodium-coupled monocarboxylate transporter 1-like [Ylistrum balloti]